MTNNMVTLTSSARGGSSNTVTPIKNYITTDSVNVQIVYSVSENDKCLRFEILHEMKKTIGPSKL